MFVRVNDCFKSGNSYIFDFCIDNGKWFEVKILRERKVGSYKFSIKIVNDVLVIVS